MSESHLFANGRVEIQLGTDRKWFFGHKMKRLDIYGMEGVSFGCTLEKINRNTKKLKQNQKKRMRPNIGSECHLVGRSGEEVAQGAHGAQPASQPASLR